MLFERQRPRRGGQDGLSPLMLRAAGASSGRQEKTVSASAEADKILGLPRP
jgi:hypothetical protein